jgi:hypothetical protein
VRRPLTKLDLLPLLDVILVVVFVLATIVEGREEVHASAEAANAQRIDVLTADSENLKRDAADAQDRLEALRQSAEETLDERFGGSEDYRQESLMEHLLKRSSIVEVELDTAVGPDPASRCCYRTDPRRDGWLTCGDMPANAEAQPDWVNGDGRGLFTALSETKAGNAMVVIRQGYGAIWRSGERLRRTVRSREPDRRGYVEVLPFEVAKACKPATNIGESDEEETK